MRRFSIWDIIVSITALAVVCAAVVPAVARLQRTPEDARCQSNMRRLAGAIEQYTHDWDGCYPTNRLKSNSMLSAVVPLSLYDPSNPRRFISGVNWVEALYDHIESVGPRIDTNRVWRCPKASNSTYPTSSATPAVNYVFNYNLLEQPSAFNRNREKLMMMREFDRMLDSRCRPANNSTANGSVPPQGPFLTRLDFQVKTANSMLHGQGSHILFADGHVQYFGSECFPPGSPMAYFDTETAQWWNYTNNSNPALNKAIAITP